MRLLFVVNPISGGKNKSAFLSSAERICEKYGFGLHYYNTTGENDVEKLNNEVLNYSPDRVVSVGGDGTSLLTSLALLGTNVPFGIIPMGSANGMARELGVQSEPVLALQDLIMSKIIVPLDLVKINDEHYSIHLGDVGVNASMVENFTKEEGRGWMAYAKHFVDSVKNAPLFDVSIEIDGQIFNHNAYAVVIANTRMYGTGAIINPRGNPHDGLFEIVVVLQNDLSGIINLGLTAITEKAFEALKGYYETYQVRHAKIKFKKPKMLQLDGELIGKSDEIEAEIVPAGVQYISTNENIFVKDL